ncbi:MAG: FkbM family methyltransferase [Cyanobacteria bacterium J06554_1]
MSLSAKFKQAVKKTFHNVGLDLHRVNANADLQLSKALTHFNIDIVFDVGANRGQFASSLYSFGYQGHIVCFEPLSDAYQALIKAALQNPHWKIHQRSAIGDFDGEVDINVASNSASSSVLPMLELHTRAEAKSAYVGTEKVPIARLDSIASDYLSPDNRLFIKIDTQGFESQVLDGANDTLKKAKGLLCELSIVPLYEGQRLWLDMMQRIESEGFTLWAIHPGFVDPRNGRTLQVDAIFFRTP